MKRDIFENWKFKLKMHNKVGILKEKSLGVISFNDMKSATGKTYWERRTVGNIK